MQVNLLSHWNEVLASLPQVEQDVYFREEYVRLYETESEKAYWVVCREGYCSKKCV